jgi:hypothetical protein
MGLPGRTSLAPILLLALVLSAVPLAAGAAEPARPRVRPVARPAASATQARTHARTHAGAGRDRFVPGRVLVGFEAGAGERGREAAAAAVDGRVLGRKGRDAVVQLEPGGDVRAAARRLAARPGVAFAEPDWIRRVDDCDPEVCWHLQPSPGANVVQARQGGATGAGQTVAVVDTGVATGVADLAGRVSARLRCTDTGCATASTAPVIVHGTEVASVVAALDNTTGTTGVAPGATIVSYQVDGDGGGIPISYLRQALLEIADDPQIDVVNLSLGGSQWSQAERDAVDAVLDAGKVVVASAGNTGDRIPQYPAAFPGVISVGATDADGQVASFSSYGKVDVVAPGDCVAVAVVPDADDVRQPQRPDCPDDPADVHYDRGTSFSAPIVSGILALAPSRSRLVARLALEATADPDSPGGDADAKQWAHGLVDADAFVAAHEDGAPPALVVETSGDEGDGDRVGSGDGQLPHPSTTWVAYAVQAGDGVTAPPDPASFSGATTGSATFAAVDGDSHTFKATLASGELGEGLQEEQAEATVDEQPVEGSVPVLVLADDDQAPGVDLFGDGDDAWRRLDSVDTHDLDDVYAVTLGKGDRLDVAIAAGSADPVAALLFQPGTEDVIGQLNRQVACGGGLAGDCPTAGLHYQAPERGTYLLDLYATGATGDYRLTWTVQNAAGLPIEVTVPACSPNGDGVRDRCAWTAGALTGWTVRSFVTRGSSLAAGEDGTGPHTWDGGSGPGSYLLRVLYTEPGGRKLLRAFALTVDLQRPQVAAATAAPNPFEPRPADGDRDTTTFAMTSSEGGRLRVVIYRYASTEVVRVLDGGQQAAGRQRVDWTGKTSSGAWLRGTFSYVIETTDAAGNTSRSQRHHVRVL